MRSGFERSVAKLFKSFGIKFLYEPDTFPYVIQRKYTPDFKIGKGKKAIYVETKGLFTSADRTKMKLVKEQNPELDIRMWFMRDNYLTKRKKQTYSGWAEKNGFLCHVGDTFPKHWFVPKEK